MNWKFFFSYRSNWASRLKKGSEIAFSTFLLDGHAELTEVKVFKGRERPARWQGKRKRLG